MGRLADRNAVRRANQDSRRASHVVFKDETPSAPKDEGTDAGAGAGAAGAAGGEPGGTTTVTIEPGEGGPSSLWLKKQEKLAEIADLRELRGGRGASPITEAEALLRGPRMAKATQAVYGEKGLLRPAFEGGIPPQRLTKEAEERTRLTGKEPLIADTPVRKGEQTPRQRLLGAGDVEQIDMEALARMPFGIVTEDDARARHRAVRAQQPPSSSLEWDLSGKDTTTWKPSVHEELAYFPGFTTQVAAPTTDERKEIARRRMERMESPELAALGPQSPAASSMSELESQLEAAPSQLATLQSLPQLSLYIRAKEDLAMTIGDRLSQLQEQQVGVERSLSLMKGRTSAPESLIERQAELQHQIDILSRGKALIDDDAQLAQATEEKMKSIATETLGITEAEIEAAIEAYREAAGVPASIVTEEESES